MGLDSFSGSGAGGGEPPIVPGDTIPIITDGSGDVDSDVNYRRDSTRPGLKIRTATPGMLFEPAAAGLGVKWALSATAIKPVSDAVASVGALDLIAHADHIHKLFAGNTLYNGATVKLAHLAGGNQLHPSYSSMPTSISFTEVSRPWKTARQTMLWPMLSVSRCGMQKMPPRFSMLMPWPALTLRSSE